MTTLRKNAISRGAKDLKKSTRKGKKWMVLYNNRWVHFGAKGMSDFTIHKDMNRRRLYRKRHGAILDKTGRKAYLNKNSPAYWSWFILW
jgi:hypothetical protein